MSAWIDVNGPAAFQLPVTSDALGSSRFTVAIPSSAGLIGPNADAHWAWGEPICGLSGISASSAIQVTILP